jgi:hypothetical protein
MHAHHDDVTYGGLQKLHHSMGEGPTEISSIYQPLTNTWLFTYTTFYIYLDQFVPGGVFRSNAWLGSYSACCRIINLVRNSFSRRFSVIKFFKFGRSVGSLCFLHFPRLQNWSTGSHVQIVLSFSENARSFLIKLSTSLPWLPLIMTSESDDSVRSLKYLKHDGWTSKGQERSCSEIFEVVEHLPK